MGVSYSFDPYMFARISAMKSLILKKQDYDRLYKLDPSEILKYLQERVYDKEINKLISKYSGMQLVDQALHAHLFRVLTKLRTIASEDMRVLMDQYLKRYDFQNLKTVLRAKFSKNETELKSALVPGGAITPSQWMEWSKLDNETILEKCKLLREEEYKEGLESFTELQSLADLENSIDYAYYMESMDFAQKLPRQGRLFKEFFQYEFDIYNLKLILKKIYFGLENDYIKQYLIKDGKYIQNMIEELLECEDLAQLRKILSKSVYGDIFAIEDEEMPLLHYEVELEKFLLKKSRLLYHQHPLSVDAILGFMFAKEIEVKNIRTIMKSKTLSYSSEFVKQLVVI